MIPLYNLKIIRLGYSLFSYTFASRTKSFVLRDLKPSHFSLQTQLFYRRITSEISANKPNFTVTYLINSCGLSPKDAISASKKVKLQSPERADSVLTLLRNHGFSETQISRYVRLCPNSLLSNPEKTLLPKLEFFSSIGVSREDLARVLASNPLLLRSSLGNRIIPTYNFLRSLLSEKKVIFVFKNCPRILMAGHCKNVVPNIGLLRELGMPQSCISLLLTHRNSVLMLKLEKFGKVVDKVREMGFNLEKSNSVLALEALASNNSKLIWNRSSQVYRRWGWSEGDILSAFRKQPMCMILSEKNIMQTMEFLVNKMGWPSEMIASYPGVLCLSLEKRIIPRASVVKVLFLKGLINENLSLSYLFYTVEKKFMERFVTRYLNEVPQLLSVYKGKAEIQDV